MFGVIGIDLSEKPLDAFENSVLLSILGEGALAIENRRNALEKKSKLHCRQKMKSCGQTCCARSRMTCAPR